MKLTIPKTPRVPVLPLLALFILAYLNIINRCADGYCYTHGWPLVAYYGWSDAGFNLDGTQNYPRFEWLPALADALIAGVLLSFAWAAHRRWRREVG